MTAWMPYACAFSTDWCTEVLVPFHTSAQENEVESETVYVGGHPEHYFAFLRERWATGKTFVVVEHDVVLTSEALRGLLACKEPWCAVPYPYLGGLYYGLGCMKFAEDLIRKVPDALAQVGRIGHGTQTHPPRHWCNLDSRLQAVLTTHGASRLHRHVNAQPLVHLGGHSHGCRKEQP